MCVLGGGVWREKGRNAAPKGGNPTRQGGGVPRSHHLPSPAPVHRSTPPEPRLSPPTTATTRNSQYLRPYPALKGPGGGQGQGDRAIAKPRQVNKRRGDPPAPCAPSGLAGGEARGPAAQPPQAPCLPSLPPNRSPGGDPLRKAGARVGTLGERPYPEPRSQSEGLAARAPAVLSLQEGVHLLTVRAQCTAPLQYGNAVPAGGGRGAAGGVRGMRVAGAAHPRTRAGADAGGDGERKSCKDAPGRAQTGREKQTAGGAESWGQGEGARKGGAGMERNRDPGA